MYNLLTDEVSPTSQYAVSPKATFQRHPDEFFCLLGPQVTDKHSYRFRMTAGGGGRRWNVISRGFTASYVSWRVTPGISERLSILPQRSIKSYTVISFCQHLTGICLYVCMQSSEHALISHYTFNLLKPNTIYICRTAALTSRRYILNIYSTNIRTEYFKHAAYSPFLFSSKCHLFHNATLFGSCIIRILPTGCAKI